MPNAERVPRRSRDFTDYGVDLFADAGDEASLRFFWKNQMVGAVRFELTTSCTPSKRATRLRYAPNHFAGCPAEFHYARTVERKQLQNPGVRTSNIQILKPADARRRTPSSADPW